MFCTIYKNTQFHLLKDTLMSFGISMFTPFGFYLLPGIFRIVLYRILKRKENVYINLVRYY